MGGLLACWAHWTAWTALRVPVGPAEGLPAARPMPDACVCLTPCDAATVAVAAQQEWSQADILMVTDGEIPQPDPKVLAAIDRAHKEMGLEVHGLLVSSQVSDAMKALCTELHVFKSWTAVGGEASAYL